MNVTAETFNIAKMGHIVLLLAIIGSLLEISGVFLIATAFPGIANHSGPQHLTPAHHRVNHYFRLRPNPRTPEHLPFPTTAVSPQKAESYKTTASRRITSSAGTVAPGSTTSSSRPTPIAGIANLPIPFYLPVIPPLLAVPNLPGPQQLSSQKTAVSRRVASSTKAIASPETTPSIRTKASPSTMPSIETTEFQRKSSSIKTTESPRTTSSTRTAASPSATLSTRTTASLSTRSTTSTTPSPTTTSSTGVDNTTEEISWKFATLQEFAERLQKECDFELLDSISEDLKNLWDEVMKEIDDPMSSEMNDMRVLLKTIIDLYNDCIHAMVYIDPERQWEIYLKIFGKEYNANATEKEMRKEIYKRNKEEVEEHNELYIEGRVTFIAGLNHFSDWTKEELERMNGIRPSNDTAHRSPKRKERFADEYISRTFYYNANFPAPASSDWRTKDSYITPVTEQGDCTSCYAFAGIGALEAYHKKNTGELVKLSVQNILDCTWHLGNNGCMGGSIKRVFLYAERAGVISDYHYPYTANASHHCQWRHERVVTKSNGYYAVEHGSELALQSAVAIQGPIAASIGTRNLHRYRSGIFVTEDCGEVDHGVLIVGYGTDPMYGDFWIVKNCWGIWWGEDGYFRMARNRNNMCNIASYASFPS